VSRLLPGLRDLALLLGGLALLWHETVVATDPRLPLLAVAIGMLGLPGSLLVDRRFVRSLNPPPAPPQTRDPETSSGGSVTPQ
jgi:hypothetical protein